MNFVISPWLDFHKKIIDSHLDIICEWAKVIKILVGTHFEFRQMKLVIKWIFIL
jgi:hypothetical protein